MIVRVITTGDSPRRVALERLMCREAARVRRRVVATRVSPQRDGDVDEDRRVRNVDGDGVFEREGVVCVSFE